MPLTTKNLGTVRALHIGTTAPTNTKMIWYDTNSGVNAHKYFDIISSTWQLFSNYSIPSKYSEITLSDKTIFGSLPFDVTVGSKIIIDHLIYEIGISGSGEEVEITAIDELTTSFIVASGTKVIIYEF